MPERIRVVVTGLGCVTPFGVGTEALLKGLLEGRSAIRRITRFDASRLTSQIAGEVPPLPAPARVDPKTWKRLDLATRFGLWTTIEAVAQAGLEIGQGNAHRTAVIVGTALDGFPQSLLFHDRISRYGPARAMPHFMLYSPDACASYLAVELGIRGASMSVSSGCSSSAQAIALGFDLLQLKRVDVVIVCGTEAPLCETVMAPFCASKALSTRNETPELACRPFDVERDGFVVAEGAATVVLESMEHARARGATPLAELAGYATTCAPYSVSVTSPRPDELVAAIRMALAMSGETPGSVDYVNAYANGMHTSDVVEAQAIGQVFGGVSRAVPVSSLKSMIGHAFGASAIIESTACILAITHGFVPPSVNCDNLDPEMGDIWVSKYPIRKSIRVILKNSSSFGNRYTSLVWRAIDA